MNAKLCRVILSCCQIFKLNYIYIMFSIIENVKNNSQKLIEFSVEAGDMKFSENLKSLRSACGAGQKQIAEMLNISLKTVSHWETGYSEPSIAQLIQLADFSTSR